MSRHGVTAIVTTIVGHYGAGVGFDCDNDTVERGTINRGAGIVNHGDIRNDGHREEQVDCAATDKESVGSEFQTIPSTSQLGNGQQQ